MPGDSFATVRVAAVQAAPVLFDRDGGVEKVRRLTAEAAAGGARLVVFPEALIPAYPWGLRFGTAVGGRTPAGRRVFERYWANAVAVPGPATEALGEAAAEAGAYVAVGVVERDTTHSGGTLYCTLLYFGPDGRLLGKHRKLKPTAAERLIWGEGDGSTLTTVETEFGRVGGLICWENYMPLARMAMYGKGIDIYLAPTADARDTWQATLRHIAFEGRCFVIGCNQIIRKDMYPADLELLPELDDAELLPEEVLNRGGSAIVDPMGGYLAGPLFGEEGILYADLDLAEIPRARFDFDVTGHYARPDIFQLIVNEQPAVTVRSVEGD
ncbi:MAG TPA: carbon-nitrogen hydrolase family protein [Longimicrobiales bacterium]|nr:carbon-nitrogen hydrolase family protein [Longimicrobiales bacterium]